MVLTTRDAVVAKEVWERTQENQPFKNSFKLMLKQNRKKVWERRSHAFPSHYTPACNMFWWLL